MNRRLVAALAMVTLLLLGAFLAACGEAPGEKTAPATQPPQPTTAPTEEKPTAPATQQPEPTTAPTEEEPTAPAALNGKALVEERCTKCHSMARIEGAAKTEDAWRETVDRMIDKGAELDGEEKEVVIQYLAETYPQP